MYHFEDWNTQVGEWKMLERGGKRRKGQNLPGVEEGGPAGVLRAEWKGCSGQVAFWSTDPH